MHKLCIGIAAAALIAVAYPASAQLSTSSSREAEQTTVKPGSMHQHVERAETVVKELLAQRSAGSSAQTEQKNVVLIERTQLEKLQGELNAIDTEYNSNAPTATSALESHITTANNIIAGLESQAHNSTPPEKIVTTDRRTVKELRDSIEAIEHLSKDKSHESKK